MKYAVLALAAALVLSGCGGGTAGGTTATPNGLVSAPPTGTVEGVFHVVGGPAPGIDNPLAGELTIKGPDGSVVKHEIGKDGTYAIALSPGDYRLTASSKGYTRCTTSPEVTTLVAGRTVHADVTCDVP